MTDLLLKPLYKLSNLSKLKSKCKILSNSNVEDKRIVQIVTNST